MSQLWVYFQNSCFYFFDWEPVDGDNTIVLHDYIYTFKSEENEDELFR